MAGIPRAVVDEMGNLTAEGVADDKPIGRPAEGTARTRGEGTAADAQGEDIEGWWEVGEDIFGPGLGRLGGRAVVPGVEGDVGVEAIHVFIHTADRGEGG